MIKAILTFLLLAFANKFVRDNLPDLNVGRAFQQYIFPLLFGVYLYWLQVAIRRAKNPDAKTRLQTILVALSLVVLLTHPIKEID
jgi:hypothetical protein